MYFVERLSEVVEGRIIRRVNRFIVEIEIDGRIIYAHNTNTGRLQDFLVGGRRALLIKRSSERSKTRYRLIGVEDVVAGDFAVIDTITQNKVFEKLVEQGAFTWMKNCRVVSKNPLYENVRFDYEIECIDKSYLVETKSAVLRGDDNEAMYPDCPTERGRRHIEKLIKLKLSGGHEPMLVFIAAMKNPLCFKPFGKEDLGVERLVAEAIRRGVSVKTFSIYMNRSGEIFLDNPDLMICREFLEKIFDT